MSAGTTIEWTEATFNPWWGCSRVSPGCVHCYAATTAKRYGHGELWRRHGERRTFGEKHWAEPLKWNRQAEERGRPVLVFCASMADVFEDHPALPPERERLWELIEATPWLVWQLLTKRPENAASMAPWTGAWPSNVWLGASAENQRWADQRVTELLAVPAAVRFLSCEPLVGPVDLDGPGHLDVKDGGAMIGWVIVGGESGARPRPMDLSWARSLVADCQAAGLPVFVKQLGTAWARGHSEEYTHPDLRADFKAGNWESWPENLKVRELPRVLLPAAA